MKTQQKVLIPLLIAAIDAKAAYWDALREIEVATGREDVGDDLDEDIGTAAINGGSDAAAMLIIEDHKLFAEAGVVSCARCGADIIAEPGRVCGPCGEEVLG